jgi:hypothetical protein
MLMVPTNLHEQSLFQLLSCYKNCYRFTDRLFQLFSSTCGRGKEDSARGLKRPVNPDEKLRTLVSLLSRGDLAMAADCRGPVGNTRFVFKQVPSSSLRPGIGYHKQAFVTISHSNRMLQYY